MGRKIGYAIAQLIVWAPVMYAAKIGVGYLGTLFIMLLHGTDKLGMLDSQAVTMVHGGSMATSLGPILTALLLLIVAVLLLGTVGFVYGLIYRLPERLFAIDAEKETLFWWFFGSFALVVGVAFAASLRTNAEGWSKIFFTIVLGGAGAVPVLFGAAIGADFDKYFGNRKLNEMRRRTPS